MNHNYSLILVSLQNVGGTPYVHVSYSDYSRCFPINSSPTDFSFVAVPLRHYPTYIRYKLNAASVAPIRTISLAWSVSLPPLHSPPHPLVLHEAHRVLLRLLGGWRPTPALEPHRVRGVREESLLVGDPSRPRGEDPRLLPPPHYVPHRKLLQQLEHLFIRFNGRAPIFGIELRLDPFLYLLQTEFLTEYILHT